MVKKIGLEIFLVLVLATLVTTIAPVGEFVGKYFSGGFGYLYGSYKYSVFTFWLFIFYNLKNNK